jgi:hypothetical protein
MITTTPHVPAGVKVTLQDGVLSLRDVSCDQCVECVAGFALWCRTPTLDGPVVLELDQPERQEGFGGADGGEGLLRLLGATAALSGAQVQPNAVVLVLDDDFQTLGRLVRLVHAGPVLATADAADPDVRVRLAGLTASGRADVVVTTRQARTAVKAVIRGGVVCLPAASVIAPTVTELVQREVRMVGATDIVALLRRVGADQIKQAVQHS